jgi:hypothetical protein
MKLDPRILYSYTDKELCRQIGQCGFFVKPFEGGGFPVELWAYGDKEQGTVKAPRYSLGEYLLSQGPIPLQGPIKYVYDQLRSKGASALDTTAIIKGLMLTGLGATGLEARAEPAPEEKAALEARAEAEKRTRAQSARVAKQLRERYPVRSTP